MPFHSFQRAYRRESLSSLWHPGRVVASALARPVRVVTPIRGSRPPAAPVSRSRRRARPRRVRSRIRLARQVVEDVTEQPQDEALDERYGRPDDGLGREPKLRPKAHARPACLSVARASNLRINVRLGKALTRLLTDGRNATRDRNDDQNQDHTLDRRY